MKKLFLLPLAHFADSANVLQPPLTLQTARSLLLHLQLQLFDFTLLLFVTLLSLFSIASIPSGEGVQTNDRHRKKQANNCTYQSIHDNSLK